MIDRQPRGARGWWRAVLRRRVPLLTAAALGSGCAGPTLRSPAPAPAEALLHICVVKPQGLDVVSAGYNPVTGDTVVVVNGVRMRLAAAYPLSAGYAATKGWYGSGAPLLVRNRSYRKYGSERPVGPSELTRFDTYDGVPLFHEVGASPPPEILYVPVRHGCVFQPYARP